MLADEMGTGKTVMTTVALRILFQQGKIRRALILCPVSVLREWDRHMREWAPDLHVIFVRGNQDERNLRWQIPAHVYVTSYNILSNDLDKSLLLEKDGAAFHAVVLDEAQYIKSPKSRRTRAVKKLQARYRWALSGTPVENKLEDLVSIFEYLHPNLPLNVLEAEWIKKEIAPYFLRRRKLDVLPDLPPKQHQAFWLELNPEQRKAYDEVESKIRREFAALTGNVTKVHIFSAITTLKQICNFVPGRATSSKVRLLKEQVEEIIAADQKVLIFTQFIEEGLMKLEKVLQAYNPAVIKGGQSDRERFSQIERFRKSPACEVPILLASV
ncbi:MAG: DEAD/DEAH box helicase, partial [Candidatus Micrarchaeota archaeon]